MSSNSTLRGTLYKCTSIAQYSRCLEEFKGNMVRQFEKQNSGIRSSYQSSGLLDEIQNHAIPSYEPLISVPLYLGNDGSLENSHGRRTPSAQYKKIESITQLPPSIKSKKVRASNEDLESRDIISHLYKGEGRKFSMKIHQKSPILLYGTDINAQQFELKIQKAHIQKREMRRGKLPIVLQPLQIKNVNIKQENYKKDILEEANEDEEMSHVDSAGQQNEETKKVCTPRANELRRSEKLEPVINDLQGAIQIEGNLSAKLNFKERTITTPCEGDSKAKNQDKRPTRKIITKVEKNNESPKKKTMIKKEIKKINSPIQKRNDSKSQDGKPALNKSLTSPSKVKSMAIKSPQVMAQNSENKLSHHTSNAMKRNTEKTEKTEKTEAPALPSSIKNTTQTSKPTVKRNPIAPPKKTLPPPKEELQVIVPKPRPQIAPPDFYTVFLIIITLLVYNFQWE